MSSHLNTIKVSVSMYNRWITYTLETLDHKCRTLQSNNSNGELLGLFSVQKERADPLVNGSRKSRNIS